MSSTLDIPLRGSSVNIVRQCGAALTDVLRCKFGCVVTFEGVGLEGATSFASQIRPTAGPEKRVTFGLPAGVQVSVWKADLANFPVHAVVNAANCHLQHNGGVALSLSNAGGPQIQKESDDYIKKYGELQVGGALIMDAGSLPCSKIIHAVGPQLPNSPSNKEIWKAEPFLRKTIWSILSIVQESCLKTVALPAISSGLFHYPLAQCANTIVTAVKQYYEHASGYQPTEIMFVNHDESTVWEMERACRQILGLHTTRSQDGAGKSKGDAKMSAAAVRIGNVRLTLKSGYMEDQQTDVIVNTVFKRDLKVGQISKALLQKAGPKMQEEMNTASANGKVIITKAYGLQCKEVYHTCCYEKEKEKREQVLFVSVWECLCLSFLNHHKSISFPAIGTGGLGLDGKQVARVMSDAVVEFSRKFQEKTDVYFVIFPSNHKIFTAFEEQMRYLSHHSSDLNFKKAPDHRDDSHDSRASTPLISLSGPSEEATAEAEQWLRSLLFNSPGAVMICNNFILHFGEQEHLQLSRLMKNGLSLTEFFERGCASMLVDGDSNGDVAVSGLQVEAMLCDIQREFVRGKERAMQLMSGNPVSFEKKPVEPFRQEFTDRITAFKHTGLHVVKVDKVENTTLRMLFDIKKQQLLSPNSQKMFQRIQAQFCDMVGHIGFSAEYAPPDDPAYGEGIYFASTVKMAMEVWKEHHWEYIHFVEAEVLTGASTRGEPGLILPPAVGSAPNVRLDSVNGGPGIAVIFCGYQALPKYIITCKVRRV
ncbi:protein mono-ADP-ribosyltransferase PARP9 [Antennarius striatus]|uniref:protein mono-ADP-ribosyltransferase PARP9 n=1 Tax=Antennarius striatus TaxID=241820 RepID=UPI0035B2D670